MDWTSLGHACWLCEAEGLRILFDPVIGPEHHGGVFQVVPRRRLVADRLRPDLIIVSHRHPDHFDVPSLRELLRLDPEAVVVTPDRLVAWAAERLGARTVKLVPAGHKISLDGVTLITTPSLSPDEWGVAVGTREGAAWNQIDTVLADAAAVREVVDRCTRELGVDRLALALVRWQPMLEVAVQLGERTAFNYKEYAELLYGAAATNARTVVPSSAGESYTGRFSAMNRQVFPASEERFLRDFSMMISGDKDSPDRRGVRLGVGERLRVRGGVAEPVAGDPGLFVADAGAEHSYDRTFAPLEPGAVVDPGVEGVDEGAMRAAVEAWVRGALADGVARAAEGAALRFVLALRFAATSDVYTLVTAGGGARVSRRFEHDWDFYNVAAGSLVWEVLQGRKHWGDVLLAGALRGCSRAYSLASGRLERLRLGELFVYHGLGYDESVERAVRRAVEVG